MSGDSAITAMRTAEMNPNYGKSNSKDVDATTALESKILEAMRSRVTYLRNKADSFTFVSVRRILEEYMGLEKFALDDHKTFVKVNMVKCLEEAGNGDASENSQETERKLSEENGEMNDVRDDTGVYEEMEGSTERGLMTGENKSKMVAKDMKDKGNKESLESDIRRVLRERTSYVKANAETITMGSLRRLLEEDLKLEKLSLDPFKKFINNELDEVLAIPDVPKRSTESTGKDLRKNVKSTQSEQVSSEENSDSDAETETETESEGDMESDEVAVKKTMPRKRRLSKPEMMGKRKSENGKHVSGRKRAKHTETDSETESDAGDSEKPFKQTKETVTTVYGKRVEHLKSVIKSCGMRVPPSIYKKAKQATEENREATLMEELEQILAKRGCRQILQRKIKEVKNRKTISKELEGLDTSNIVSSSRKRSTTSFAPPPKPKFTVDSESETESDEPEDAEGSEEEEEGNEETEGSQSEEEEEGYEETEGSQSEEEDSNSEDDGGEESE